MDRDASWAQRLAIGAVAVFGSILVGLGVGGSWIALALLGAIVLFAASFFVPMVGLIVLGFMLPTYSMTIESLNNSSPFRVAGTIVFLAWCLNIMVRRERLPHFRTIDWFAMIYIVSLIMSTILTGGTIVDIATDLQLVLLYVLVLSVARTFVDTRRLLIAILVGQIFVGGVAAYQRETRNYTFLNYTGEAETWGNRASGLSQPNETGAKLGYTFPLVLMFLLSSRTPWLVRGTLVGSALVMLFGLFGTQSRGGIVTLLVACLSWLAMLGHTMRAGPAGETSEQASVKRRYAVWAMVAFLLMGAFYMKVVRNQLSESFVKRWSGMITELSTDPFSDRAGTGRMRIWKKALQQFAERPIFGHGPGTQVGEEEGEGGMAAHNTPLEVLVQGGILASVPFHLVFWLSLAGLWRVRKVLLEAGAVDESMVTGTLLVVVLSIMIGAFFGTFAYDKDVWLFLALASAMISRITLDMEGFLGERKPKALLGTSH